MRAPLLFTCLLLALAIGVSTEGWAAESRQHDHPTETLSLDHGKKWSVDDPLRQSMDAIRSSTVRAFTLPQKDTLGHLAKTIQMETDNIIRQCRLPPTADATLHVFLAKLLEHGPKLTFASSPGESKQNLMAIVETLNHYGHYFDHPDWRDIR
ncbi:MAG: hypothetical protein HQL86_01735 [Magnetococcales bacterium]|nr:hypothetical protein [Magnetococcales bacterium]